ncbi:Lpg1974 family pore-forming outer membrane protein [Rosistilla oblonga]|uniref:Lpg1974 family pore-forming outer membrane protein n=1 Tax=Rosistilla oblonga TaxID=2527990 RepID=UPI003A980A8C
MKVWASICLGLVSVSFCNADSGQPIEAGILGAEDGGLWQQHLQRMEQLDQKVESLSQRLAAEEAESSVRYQPKRPRVPSSSLTRPGWNASVDYLNWTVRRRGLDYAITTDDSTRAVGAGDVHNVEYGSDSGIRAGLHYTTATGWEVGFRYTYLDIDATSSAESPAAGNMWATRSHPNENEEARRASASANLDYDVFDLELRRWFLINRVAAIQFLGGLRWASIDQNLQIDYDGDDFSDGQVFNDGQMDGFGVRLGALGQWQMSHGLSLFARGAGTLAYGKFENRLLETNRDGADTIVDVTDRYEQALPAIEAAVGLSWRSDHIELACGYELTNWFDLSDRSMFVDSAHEGAYSPKSTDLLLDGLFARMAFQF